MSLTRNSRIGLVLLLVSTVALGWSLAGKPNPFSHPATVQVELRDASTLIHFDRDVRMAGAIVGRARDVRRRGDLAVVTLQLTDDARSALRSDASAELRPHTLFDGNSFVELHPGSASAPALPGAITVAHTTNYVSLDKALRVFGGDTRHALQASLRDLRRSLGPHQTTALRRTFRATPRLFAAQARWARAAQGPTRHELSGTIAGFANTVAALSRARGDIGPALHDFGPTLAALRGTDDALGRTLDVLPSSLRSMRTGSDALSGTLRQARTWAADATPALRALAPAMVELQPVLAASIPAWRQARPLAVALHGTLSQARVAGPPTARLLDALRPVFAQAADRFFPFLNSRTSTNATVLEELMYTTSSGTSMLSPVTTPAEGQADRSGPGHGQYSHVNVDGTEASCKQAPSAVSPVLQELALCVP